MKTNILLLLTITMGCLAVEKNSTVETSKNYQNYLSTVQNTLESHSRTINAVTWGYILSGKVNEKNLYFKATQTIISFPAMTIAAYGILALLDGIYAILPVFDLPYKLLGKEEFSSNYPRISRALMWGFVYNQYVRKAPVSKIINFVAGPIALLQGQLLLDLAWYITNAPANLLHGELSTVKYIANKLAGQQDIADSTQEVANQESVSEVSKLNNTISIS